MFDYRRRMAGRLAEQIIVLRRDLVDVPSARADPQYSVTAAHGLIDAWCARGLAEVVGQAICRRRSRRVTRHRDARLVDLVGRHEGDRHLRKRGTDRVSWRLYPLGGAVARPLIPETGSDFTGPAEPRSRWHGLHTKGEPVVTPRVRAISPQCVVCRSARVDTIAPFGHALDEGRTTADRNVEMRTDRANRESSCGLSCLRVRTTVSAHHPAQSRQE
ncbi:hypothetical protein GCM10009662_49550 [Catellatospora coxensis]|uniref:Uncharacterized protein n=1 Tax=Catellatospora coxensis TaxID=310354 RepID=A0A8J3KS07_9ACTN|nr:hypothetical protein Cco03nite_27950 [Catellatospora coxensis]